MNTYQKITKRLIAAGYIAPSEQDIYIYGLDIIVYTIVSTIILLITGMLLCQLPATVILVAGFYTFQTTGGGYHARTHLHCLLKMLLGLMTGLSFCFLSSYSVILWAMMVSGATILLIIPLVIHPRKKYLECKRKRLTHRSYVITLSLLSISIIINLISDRFLFAFSAAFLLSSASRMVGQFLYGNIQKEL